MGALRGFTLMELLVTLAIGAILLSLAVPYLGEMVRNHRLASASNGLVSALQLARSEAIKRNTLVTLCRSADGRRCGAGTGWTDGWVVFVEDQRTSGNTIGVLDDSERAAIVGVQAAPGGAIQVTAAVDAITFNPGGRPDVLTDFLVCDDRTGAVGNRVRVSATGQIRLEKGVSCP